MLGTQGGGVQHYFGDALCNEKVILEILCTSFYIGGFVVFY
jgi:hypothetical protein